MWIAQVADKEPGAIGVTKTRLSLISATCGQRGGVEGAHLFLAARLKGHHGAIASRGRLSIEGRFDVEIRQSRRLARLHWQDIA